MKIDVVSRCNRRLNFYAKAVWPEALPAVAWGGICLAGFNGDTTAECLFIERDEKLLENVLAGLYPKLSFIELARLAGALNELDVGFNWREFSALIGYHWNDDWPALFSIVRQAPADLVRWWEQRDVSARDLAPLRAFTDELQLTQWFHLASHVAKFQPSRSDGVQVLEWLVDLMLSANATDSLFEARSFIELKEQVRAARFPMATHREKSQSDLAAKLPWPVGAKAAWVRQGDRGGIEIKLFSKSAGELEKQISSLQNAALEWTKCDK